MLAVVAIPPPIIVGGGHNSGGTVPLWFAVPFTAAVLIYCIVVVIAAWKLTR